MPVNRFNKEFAKQFRQEHIPYSGTVEQQHDHLVFRQYSGNEQELAWLGQQLSGTIHDLHFIRQFINKMENETMPDAIRLSDYIAGVTILFSDYAEAESYTATYYNHLVLALTDFFEQTDTFRNDIHDHLLLNLKKPFVNEPGRDHYLDIDSNTLRKIEDVIEYYLDNFEAYDNYFTTLVRQESNSGKGVAVTSQVANYLSEMVTLTEKVIAHLGAIRELLFAWEIQLADRESQELYN